MATKRRRSHRVERQTEHPSWLFLSMLAPPQFPSVLRFLCILVAVVYFRRAQLGESRLFLSVARVKRTGGLEGPPVR